MLQLTRCSVIFRLVQSHQFVANVHQNAPNRVLHFKKFQAVTYQSGDSTPNLREVREDKGREGRKEWERRGGREGEKGKGCVAVTHARYGLYVFREHTNRQKDRQRESVSPPRRAVLLTRNQPHSKTLGGTSVTAYVTAERTPVSHVRQTNCPAVDD